MLKRAWHKKSIKTYFLKGKGHELGDVKEDQNEKMKRHQSASEAKQPRMDGNAQNGVTRVTKV